MFEIDNKDFMKDINNCNIESKEICNQIIYELKKQEEVLINTDYKLNKSKENLNLSTKILDNMTWSGWLSSFLPFLSFKELLNILYKKTNNRLLINNNDNTMHDNNIDNNIIDGNDTYLIQLEKDLTDLKYAGKEIGKHLDLHNIYIDSISNKSHNLIESIKTNNKKTNNLL